MTGTISSSALRSASFTQAALRSERVRIVGMLVVLGLLLGLGILRVARPAAGAEPQGPIILSLAIVYLVYEAVMLRRVVRSIATATDLSPRVWRLNAVAESLLPVVVLVGMVRLTDINPFAAILGPALAFMFVLMIMSVLRIDPMLSLLGGAVSTAGYAAVTTWVFLMVGAEGHGVLHWSFHASTVLLLLVGTAVATFVTSQIRRHVLAALREAEVRREKERLERDLDLARTIQRGLLPSEVPEIAGYDLAAASEAADQTGGDYYDWQTLDDGRIVMSLGDVTGHGVGPALITAACRAYVRACIEHRHAPAEVLDRVNRLLHTDIPEGKFVTFAMLELEPAAHRAVFLAAGHAPSFYVRGADGGITSVPAQGLPLGILPDTQLDAAVELSFEPGDAVVLFSDGFFEWANAAGEQFGLDRLRDVVRECRHEPAERIVEAMDTAVRAYTGRAQDDDMTVVVVKRTAR